MIDVSVDLIDDLMNLAYDNAAKVIYFSCHFLKVVGASAMMKEQGITIQKETSLFIKNIWMASCFVDVCCPALHRCTSSF